MKEYIAMDNINLMHTTPVKWPEEFKQFHNIIYTRLDLPTPPVLDEDKFEWWSQKSESYLKSLPNSQYIKTRETQVEYTSAYHNNLNVRKESYPFILYPVISKNRSLTDDPWVEGFDKLFPDMVEYYHLFPGSKFRSLGFLKQNTGIRVWDHTDTDEWIGLRFYLKNNCNTDNLSFKKIKKEYLTNNRYTTYIDTGDSKVVRDFSGITEDEKIYVRNNNGNYAWAMTSTKATHNIDAYELTESRITGVIEYWPYDDKGIAAGFKIKETIDLFERSILKHKDDIIWYK